MMYRKDALWSSDAKANEWKEVELPPETLAKLSPNRWNAVYRITVEEFVRCIETGGEHPTSGRQAREALELIMGAYASHRRKARVSIPLELREHPLALWSE